MLKADFHIHTGEEIKDSWISYSAKELIDYAASLDFEVLSITNHDLFTYNEELVRYAEEKGILLIPGVEAQIENKHIIILNATEEAAKIDTFSELKEYKEKNKQSFILAAHPYYVYMHCLGRKFKKYVDLFDGVEYCYYHCKGFNAFNKKAVRKAKKHNLPVIGTSDSHKFLNFNTTYTLVDSEKNIESVIEALRKGKVIVKTKPLSYSTCLRVIIPMWKNKLRRILEKFK